MAKLIGAILFFLGMAILIGACRSGDDGGVGLGIIFILIGLGAHEGGGRN